MFHYKITNQVSILNSIYLSWRDILMKINKMDIIHIKVPMKKPYKLSKAIGTVSATEPIIIKIYTDEGIVGIGETDPLPPFTEETSETVKLVINKYLGPAIIGMSPLNIAEIHKAMDGIIKGNYLAKAAIDMACYDILGKFSGMPVSDLLGGCIRDEIGIMWSIGSDEPEQNAEESLKIRNEGYSSLMIKVGSFDMMKDVERVIAIREAVGEQFPLIVDANQGWDVNTAIKFAALVEDCNIELLEQPVPYWNIEGMLKIKESINIPISADESLFTIHDAKKLIQSKAVDVFSIKVAKNGGIYKSKEIIDLAAVFGIPCMMNSMLEEGICQAASLQLGASAKNLWKAGHAYFSPLRLAEDITDYSTQIIDGKVIVNKEPGLGIKVIEEKLKKYKVDEFQVEI